jgi:hypothetical protein
MAPKKFRGQSATLEMTNGSLPADPFGVLQEVTVTPTHTVEELRGAGDVRWQDLMKTSVAVEITGTVASWDLETWDRLVDYDDVAGGFSSDPDVPTFQTTVTWTASDGSTKDITMNPGYMDPPPEIGGSREEWVNMDLSIRAKEVTSITNTDAST